MPRQTKLLMNFWSTHSIFTTSVLLTWTRQVSTLYGYSLIRVHYPNLYFYQMVLSCAPPCIQGISDPVMAGQIITQVNNQLAQDISNNTLRFGAFAALSMHNATQAALELK